MSINTGKEETAVCDVRIERTRTRLADAVLKLAAECDIATVSVTDLTRLAGVNRGTFYDHAQSPIELLTRVLSCELDDVRRAGMAQLRQEGLLFRHLTRSTLSGILQHVLKHEAIYAGQSSNYALRIVLAEHIEHSMLAILGEGFVKVPMPEMETKALVAAYLGHGAVGAIEAWLRLPRPRNESTLLSSIEGMYPSWLAPELRE
ncbi:TetR family transcriptional regulator [Mangrovibacter plantisponsor]|uniref:TetR family transcriptional regulator n=2 Tax=Mangrovibacter plantisponsor TaxID=451513 RepID=A0A317PY20_9ENTR|nr:TetR family transcriptional regulator [Mangrovibacter plantisponsor]